MGKGEVNIREAAEGDVAAMVGLWNEMMDFHQELDQIFPRTDKNNEGWIEFIRDHLSKEESCVLVAEQNGQIVGHSLAFISEFPPVISIKEYGIFQELAVTAGCRRSGIGKGLFNETLNWFRKHGIKHVEVQVSIFNELSMTFWRKMGFRPYLETLCMEI
jgi:GNAT superfamily N-acetyltransferase